MKINKINKAGAQEMMTVNAKLIGIDQYTNKNSEIIVVKTNAGNFSGFLSTFNTQNLDVDTLAEGDELEITYTIYKAKNNVEYKNFKKIEKITTA